MIGNVTRLGGPDESSCVFVLVCPSPADVCDLKARQWSSKADRVLSVVAAVVPPPIALVGTPHAATAAKLVVFRHYQSRAFLHWD